MYSCSCDQAVQTLVLLSNFCNASIESSGIRDVHLAVMDGASKLFHAFLGLIEICHRFW